MGQLARRVGRVLLWAFVALVVVRGLGAILSPPPETTARPAVNPADRWPTDAAKAWSVNVTKAYLTFSPENPEFHELALKPYLAAGLRPGAGLEVPDSGPDQVVEEATVAEARPLAGDRALVTVAAVVASKRVTTRYLTVPVARDRRGGLALFDYPAFSAPPARAEVAAERSQELEPEDAEPIEKMLARFFGAYLSGRAGDLDYFLPAGTRLEAVRQDYEFQEIVGIEQVGERRGSERIVLAVLRASDPETDATYLLRYRVGLVRRDRWYVLQLNANR